MDCVSTVRSLNEGRLAADFPLVAFSRAGDAIQAGSGVDRLMCREELPAAVPAICNRFNLLNDASASSCRICPGQRLQSHIGTANRLGDDDLVGSRVQNDRNPELRRLSNSHAATVSRSRRKLRDPRCKRQLPGSDLPPPRRSTKSRQSAIE